MCAGGGGARAPPGPRPSQPPGLGACLPPARTGCPPPPPLLLARALHASLPAVACFVLTPEDGSDLFLIGSYLKGGSVPYFPVAWRNGGRIHPHFPKPVGWDSWKSAVVQHAASKSLTHLFARISPVSHHGSLIFPRGPYQR